MPGRRPGPPSERRSIVRRRRGMTSRRRRSPHRQAPSPREGRASGLIPNALHPRASRPFAPAPPWVTAFLGRIQRLQTHARHLGSVSARRRRRRRSGGGLLDASGAGQGRRSTWVLLSIGADELLPLGLAREARAGDNERKSPENTGFCRCRSGAVTTGREGLKSEADGNRTRKKTGVLGASLGAPSQIASQHQRELDELADAWPRLTPAQRVRVLAVVRGAVGGVA